jgi:hypothetical protein
MLAAASATFHALIQEMFLDISGNRFSVSSPIFPIRSTLAFGIMLSPPTFHIVSYADSPDFEIRVPNLLLDCVYYLIFLHKARNQTK